MQGTQTVMTTTRQWSFGDRVVHAQRPEWGTGVISTAANAQHEGQPCQMLTIRFERAGLKTLSTAFANLLPANEVTVAHANAAAAAKERAETDSDPFAAEVASQSTEQVKEALTRVPESARDPFMPLTARMKATFDLYRYGKQGGVLLDWAAAQTGIADPLSMFSRHELEQLFDRFTVNRDQHLKKLVLDFKKQDAAGLPKALAAAPVGAQQALRRMDVFR
jgi:hypothetical protein